jgi:phosphotransferase system, enzyme I, PtsP
MTPDRTGYESSLLLTLDEVNRLVALSHDPGETLGNIVELIQKRFRTDVCSVYLLEPEGNWLVLGATVGLDPKAVGGVRMRLNEGLTGLVAQQASAVMVADAPHHPRFKYFPEAGEDPYHSFLGVPLVEGGTLLGVLVVQTREPRSFTPNEVHTCITLASQLTSLVADSQLLGRVLSLTRGPGLTPQTEHDLVLPGSSVPLTGTPLSPGSGLGQAYVVDGFDEWRRTIPMESANLAGERARLAAAGDRAREEITTLSRHISELVGESHGAILHAQMLIMQDRTIEQDIDQCLRKGASAEGALFTTLDKYVAAFQRVSTPYFQERVYDIKDVFHRLLWQLRAGAPREGAGVVADRVVLVAREASVMELFAIDLDRLAGVVVEHGGAQSHAAILARSLGIPMVGQVSDFAALLHPGRRLLIDGNTGAVILDPPADVTTPARPQRDIAPSGEVPLPGQGPCGPRVEVNINLLYEARPAVKLGAGGVGLYRSEFLFLARRTLPTEEEQVEIYRKLLGLLEGRPVCIRTFDLRPDKLASYSHLGQAVTRPFDWRRVLDSPPLQQLFREQLRAIQRAAVGGPLRIMVPLVTSSEVLDFVMETLAESRESLRREGLPFQEGVPLGVMIETAAAVPLVSEWAPHVEFFALGTNDLTASALGLDRDDPLTTGQLDSLHPGIVRMIHDVTVAAHKASKPISVCGELAADPVGCLALAAMEVDSISVPVNQYSAVRRALAGRPATDLVGLRHSLLQQRTAGAIRELLKHEC